MHRPGSVTPRRASLTVGAILGLLAVALARIALFAPATPTAASNSTGQPGALVPRTPSTGLVISQVYGGGGNSGSLYTNDFVELFNRGADPVTITDWSIQYSSAAGSAWTNRSVLTGTITIQPGRYFLVQEAQGAGGTQPLPTPDNIGSIAMGATAGKVALVNSSALLTCGTNCANDPAVVDFVGYGTTANNYEGAGPAPAPSNTTSDVRNGAGCVDTDNNSLDFSIANPPTPRNSASAPNVCAVPTATNTAVPPTDTAVVPTDTPGGPTSTSTSTPADTATSTATSISTATATATNTQVVNPLSGVELYMFYTQALSATNSDEAVRLINTSVAPVVVGGWQISTGGAGITLPAGATIPAGGKIWITNRADSFRPIFGFTPDYEYGADSDPTVPQATAPAGFNFPDAGGVVQLLDNLSANQDTLVYGTGNTGSPGWSGAAVRFYLPAGQPTFVTPGQILYRKLDETTGRPVADTNTVNDWAQDNDPTGSVTPVPGDREYDDVNGKKILHPGWALTNPAYEDMFFTKKYTDTNVTTQFLIDPDNSYDAIRNLIVHATTSITIETYEWHSPTWVQDVIDAKNRGVQVDIVLDGNPCCADLPDDETLWSAKQWEDAGIPVYFFSYGAPNSDADKYRYNNTHAKIMIVDHQWVVTGADNFAQLAMTSDSRANGTAGERGIMMITNAPDVVAYTARLTSFDFQPGVFADLVRYPGLGTPPPNFTPTVLPDMTGYTPVKPTPLVVNETESFEIIQAPDNALRDVDSLIGLVNSAGPGDEVMVEQQYERKYWDTNVATGPNPRLEAYIRAAQRGANVRILLDGFFEGGDCSSLTHNPASVAYVNGLGLPNLQAKLATPTAGYPAGGPPNATTGNIHNKMVLVRAGTQGYIHATSINGSANSAKSNREYGLQVQSNAGYAYYKDMFDYDWGVGFLPCGGGGGTPTPTGTPVPPPTCNLLVNGDFETGQQAPWATTTPGITAAVVDEPVYEGNFAIGVTSVFTVGNGGSQGLQQNLTNIVGGATYRVSAAVLRSAPNIASARIRITWYPCPTPGTCSGTNADMFLGNNGPDWQYISALMPAPATAMSARFKPVFYTSDGNPATIYFDALVFDCNGGSTATPTATATASATVTSTATATDTPPPTETTTQTPPPSATATATSVPTSTTTSTALPTSTATGTAVPTSTTTSTTVPSATATQTAPPSAIATRTTQPSATPTQTTPPSVTPTRTTQPSATASATTQPSATVTTQPGATSTATGQPSATATTQASATRTTAPSATGTAQASPTRTTAPAVSSTPTAQASATGTATPCAVSFSDVHPTDYFYVPVQYLACHGIVSGYADGTFRPYNQTTRGQMVKIVALAFNLPAYSPPNTYTFADVPPSNPFFVFIESAAHANVVSGYACGAAPGEPCDAQNRPYFRPFANVTRGQLSKIVVVAAGWTPINPATPSFQDVFPNTAFYTFVETAYCHGIISGYSCGGTGEPCGPSGKPYFRQFNDATRGQIAKIVYGALTGSQSCATP